MIRKATYRDAQNISVLALSLISFLSSNSEGTLPQEFMNTLTTKEYLKRFNSEQPFQHYVYEIENKIVAYISYVTMVEDTHIFHLFVDKQYHKMGIAKKLWNFMLHESTTDIYTVNSSLWAIEFYKNLGFLNSSLIQTHQGLEYQPMIMMKEDIK